MRNQKSPSESNSLTSSKTNPAVESLLREARKLHRVAKSGSVSDAMPIIRRVEKSGVCFGQPVSSLYNQRQTLKRKHFLRMLSIEAGYNSWESYKPVLLAQQDGAAFTPDFDEKVLSTLNLWFSTEEEAQTYANQHGGEVLKYGNQAVVIPRNANGEVQ
ncbi:hypothetical protein VINI7043_21276 [Vibrio nigripulchritudo ATCC 27043]|uniref:hypothetical protein n=1 Tax=Vibrio nigripulchritudo TaxID=28173 RepID=UPI00021C1B31|nr:hypothetical protein [Vibrio nigripulchritudo]EGU61701.1 hypothetical protein VINI7043_21276 [Vibrio nigripulchritudo ATCC 27043]